MAIDMSGVYGEGSQKAIKRARELLEKGNLSEAALAYAQAAKLMKKYADEAASSEIRKKRLADAEKLFKYAQQLRKGENPADVSQQSISENRAGSLQDTADNEQAQYIQNAQSLISKAKVGWDDIAGLEDVRRFVKESYGLAMAKRPAGIGLPRAANLMLYGPPGTGKTLIAAAVSKGLEATFFNCKVSDMLSKYFGESTKLIDAVFDLAQQQSPSVIFLDDFESLVPSRDGQAGGAERRVLTELLACMDGFESKNSEKLVLVVAATNKPWLIDSAILSRFGKMAYIPLPDANARSRIFELLLVKKGYTLDAGPDKFAQLTEGYSGREIEQICRELIRNMIGRANPGLADLADKGKKALRDYTLKVEPLKVADLHDIVKTIRPVTGKAQLEEFEKWTQNHD